jgi:hypothetical protein
MYQTFLSRYKGINSETLYHVLSAKGNRINILSRRVRVRSQAIAHKFKPKLYPNSYKDANALSLLIISH